MSSPMTNDFVPSSATGMDPRYFTEDHIAQAMRSCPWLFRMFARVAGNIEVGALVFTLPTGAKVGFGNPDASNIGEIVLRRYDVAMRTLLGGDIGFFESFADGDWDSPDLSAALHVIALNTNQLQRGFHATAIVEWIDRLRHRLRANSKQGSKRNIAAHYDLGNSFYEKWLDGTMTYSSAKYDTTGTSLDDAQLNKYRSLATHIDIKPEDNILEIGSGWGGFAEYAAKTHGASVTGLTLSKEQLDYSKERIFNLGLAEKVKFKLQDYRDLDQTFDKIASIEMFEAVGRDYWPVYFDKVRTSLNPGGIAGFQVITIADALFDRYARASDFIQKYVFPGGMLPSQSILKAEIESAGMSIKKSTAFGQDYARTLAEWHQRFLGSWEEISTLGFDERFKKLWRFYLSYCEAGFKAGSTDVCQITALR